MNVISTELLKPSSFNIHVFISEKIRDVCGEKAKTGENVEIIQTFVGFAEKARGNPLAAENLEQVPITRNTLPLKIRIMMTTRLNPQMPIQHTTIQLTLEVTTEKKFWTMMMMRYGLLSELY